MGQARDEAGNIWETDAQGNAIRLLQPAAAGPQAITIGGPKPGQQYIEPQAAADLTNTQGTIADRRADNQRADTALAGELYAKGLRVGANGQIEPIPGWVKPGLAAEAGAALTAEERGKALNQYGSLVNLADGVNDLRRQFETNFKGWNPLEAIDTLPGGQVFGDQGRIFNDTSNSLTAYIATALGLSGQQFNTPAEQQLFINGILPKAGDTDGQIQAKLDRLDRLIGNARDKGRTTLGYTDDNDPLLANPAFGEFLNRTGGGGGGAPPPPPPTAAGSGATQQSLPIPAEMQQAHTQYLAQNWGRITPEGYSAFRAQLDRQYGFEPNTEAYLAFAPKLNDMAAKGASPNQLGAIPAVNAELSGVDRFRNDLVSNPVGAFMASAGNAGGFGIPSLALGDQIDALREANPVASTLGEFAGSVTGTMGAGSMLSAASGRVGNAKIAELLANPISADTAYGLAYGATQNENPWAGAAAGAGAAFGGSVVGRAIGRALPGMTGVRREADQLGRGERRVLDAVNRTGQDPVLAALAEAEQLGVPASLADVSAEVNSLTGAALRRSPSASGAARDTLAERSRGQYDRFVGAVQRDLGPVESIPQRSEDLIGQARAAARPLYDAAYAAPGASVIELGDLMARPSMSRALANARRIAAEEGRDPNQLGFVIDDAGNVTMTQQPSWQTLDYIKRGLDDVLEGYRDKTSGRLVLDTEGRAVNDTLREFLGRVDSMNPEYAAARASYAGPAAEREALQRGMQAISMSPDQLAVAVRSASPAQRDQMQLGFQSALAENAGKLRYSTNPFESVLGTPAMEQRLSTLYDSDANIARLLLQRDLEREVAASTNRLVGNSMTAERQIADQAFDQSSLAGDIATGTVEMALTGAPVVTAARSGIGRGLGNAVRDWRALGLGRAATQTADEIAPIALNTNPTAAAAQLRSMAERDAAYQAIVQNLLETAATRGGHAGAGVSSTIAAELMR